MEIVDEKKQEIIRKYLINYYGLELKDYSSIEFKLTPLPNLSIKDVKFEIKDKLVHELLDTTSLILPRPPVVR